MMIFINSYLIYVKRFYRIDHWAKILVLNVFKVFAKMFGSCSFAVLTQHFWNRINGNVGTRAPKLEHQIKSLKLKLRRSNQPEPLSDDDERS